MDPTLVDGAWGMLERYLPQAEERAWLLHYLGRCLCPSDGSKLLLFLTDGLDFSQGNCGKSSLLAWLQMALGPDSALVASGHALTVARSGSLLASGGTQLLRMFDELGRAAGRSKQQQLDCAILKYLTSGKRNQPATIIAANLTDMPDWQATQDPAFMSRTVFMPARARFLDPAASANIHQSLEQLAPALARILVDECVSYKTCGSQLLPVPKQMLVFKDLVVRASALNSFLAADVAAVKQWVADNVSTSPSCNTPAELLLRLFADDSVAQKHRLCDRWQVLLDGALASCGVGKVLCGTAALYEGVWPAHLPDLVQLATVLGAPAAADGTPCQSHPEGSQADTA